MQLGGRGCDYGHGRGLGCRRSAEERARERLALDHCYNGEDGLCVSGDSVGVSTPA